jgi:hypothetical protein
MGWDQRRWVWVVSPLPLGPPVWPTASPGCSSGGATSEGTGGARRRGADYAAVTRGSDGRSMGSARVLFLCGLFDPVGGVLRHHKRRPSARAKLPCGGLRQFAGAGCDARGAVPPALARCGPGCCPARAPWQGHASGPGCGVRAASPTPATASFATRSAAHRQGRSRRAAAWASFAEVGCDAPGAVLPALARRGRGCCSARALWQGHSSGPGCGVGEPLRHQVPHRWSPQARPGRQGRSRRAAAGDR